MRPRSPHALVATRPKLGFLGVGWIGRSRLEAMARSGLADIAVIADPSHDAVAAVSAEHSDVQVARSLDELLESQPAGVVIATPSAMHVDQVTRALAAGSAVFCQKPLGLTATDARAAVAAAHDADLLLGVDMSYMHLAATAAVQQLLDSGELGEVFDMELVFHNAYGPDKAWFYDYELSGGGCLIDLGTHLIDLALRFGGADGATLTSARRLQSGREVDRGEKGVEDFAAVELQLPGGAVARVACSWNLHAGRDAVISIELHGTRGGAAIRNVGGSFYDFEAVRFQRTSETLLAAPPDDWSGRAGVEWLRQLAGGSGYDAAVDRVVTVAELIDEAYGR